MPKRLFAGALLGAVLVGCAPGVASPVQPASPTAGAVAVTTSSPSDEPSVTPDATPTSTPGPTPMPSPTPTPEPWQSFKSKLGYSIKYPPDWVATPATPGYGDAFDDRGSTWIFVDRDVVGAGSNADLARTAKAEIAHYKSHNDAKVLSNKKAKVAGWNGRLIKMTGAEGGLETYFQVLLVAKGRVGYFIEWQSVDDDRAADGELFRRIYRGFKPKH